MATRVVERRIVTVLFADLVGFTALSERLDAEDVSLIQDAYFDAVRETIERHGGQLEKFVGDAAMAVFGAPRVRDDDAERAVRAGLALVAAVERLGASLGLDEGALRLRVGVNSGEAVYGESTEDRGPVTGDTVNVAARLQAAADPGSVVVGEITALAVADVARLERLDALSLKGKAEPVAASRVAGLYPERSRERALGALRAPMLGRDAEFARLLEAFGTGPGRIVVVAPPGVGKTRLLDEFGSRAPGSILRARLRPDLLSPFEPVGQLVRSAGDPADVVDRLPRGRGEVVRDALTAVVAPVASGGGEERDRLFAAWLEGLDALTAGGPAAWLVEDVHWGSRDLLAFLDLAGRTPTDEGRLIVATARPTVLDTEADWCAGGHVLHLPPLPAPDTAALVRALVGAALASELVERIAAASGGNALFVEELLRTWVDTGALVQDDRGEWTLAVDAQEVVLPATVQAIYAGQLDDLPPDARTAARRASVAGRRFPSAALETLEIENGVQAVATLVRRALVGGPHVDPTLGESYVYRHALLRDAGYASLARAERARLHLRLADWLAGFPEEALPSLAEVVARHYAAALDSAPTLAPVRPDVRPTAAAWFERASALAARLGAWESARALAVRSLELTGEEQPALRARRLALLAGPTENVAGVEEAKRLLREALDLYRAQQDRNGVSSSGAALGRLLWAQTRFEEAEELANGLLEEIGAPQDAAYARLLLTRAAGGLGAWSEFERSGRDAHRALELAREVGDETLELEALELTATIASERGEDASTVWAAVEELTHKAGRWEMVAMAMRARASVHVDDEPEKALPLFAAAGEFAEAHGLIESAAWSHYARAEANFAGGNWADAVEAGLRAIEIGEKHDFYRVVVRSWFVLLPIASACGRADLARRAHPYFVARTGRDRLPDSKYSRVVATAAYLHLAAFGLEPAFVPDLGERLESFELDHAGPSWLAGIETLVAAWLDAGDDEGAGEALDRMRARLDAETSTTLARATEALLRARLLHARGDRDGAAGEAERALAALGPNAAPWWRAKAIRVLEWAGAASATRSADARAIEERLGLERPQS